MEKKICATLRVLKEGPTSQIFIGSGFDVYNVMKFLENEDREKFYALHLDAKNRVLAIELLAVGTLTHSLVHPREIFKGAIINNSASIILVHNHPSGDTSPSHEDLQITERLSQAGSLLGINVHDHLILGNGIYHSIKFESYKPSILSKKSETKKANKTDETIKSDSKLAKIADTKPSDKTNSSDILDRIAELKYKICFLTIAMTSILESNKYSNDVICGLQGLMFPIENDLDKISSALNEKFNLPT